MASFQSLRWEHGLAHGLLIVLPWIGSGPLEFTRVSLPLWIERHRRHRV
jgi:hypothetical protein